MNHSAKVITPLIDGGRPKTGNALLDAVPNSNSVADNFYASGMRTVTNSSGADILRNAKPNESNTGDMFYANGQRYFYSAVDGVRAKTGNPLLDAVPNNDNTGANFYADGSQTIVSKIKANPMPFVMVGVGLGLIIYLLTSDKK